MDNKLSFKLVTIAGIDVRLHISVSIIFVLIVIGVGNGVLLEWHPDWGLVARWGTATATAVLFFVSLLMHELSHSIVAQLNNIKVPRITLFLFGGIAEMDREAPTPGVEFMVAGAGPLMSFALSFLFYAIFATLAPPGFGSLAIENQIAAMGSLSAPSTGAYWLASVNFILGVFNLVPGFPLDGGRLFRAFLWWRSNDQVKATRRAADFGRYFGWMLMGLGFYNFVGGDTIGGIWLIFIGWFISRLAAASIPQLLMDRALRGLSVQQLMRNRFETVESDVSVETFVHDYLLRSSQALWPVRCDNQDLGVLSLAGVGDLKDPLQSSGKVRDVMQPLAAAAKLDSSISGKEALQQLSENPEVPLPVVSDGRIIGLVHQGDILRWLSLHISDENQRH
ncbi:MAG: site-2 protease family protein [Pseudomonadales bacterium]|nr:site-2 protease family protein [Pseudomonadales bacterium]